MFIFFFISKFVANFLMTKFSANKVLALYAAIGVLDIFVVAFAPGMAALYGAVFASFLFGPCWATIYARTLDAVEKKYTETAGAIIVMSIIGGAFVPALQGYVSDITGSMQLSFIVNVVCFAFIAWYFHKEARLEEGEEMELADCNG